MNEAWRQASGGMKTIADLIAVLQTLPPDARVAHYGVYEETGEAPPQIYYGIIRGEPLLWTEYDYEVFDYDGEKPKEIGTLWKEMIKAGDKVRVITSGFDEGYAKEPGLKFDYKFEGKVGTVLTNEFAYMGSEGRWIEFEDIPNPAGVPALFGKRGWFISLEFLRRVTD